MKKFFIAMVAVLFIAGVANAAGPTVDLSGSFYVRGSYISNDTGLEGNQDKDQDGDADGDAGQYMYYDQELDSDLKISAADKTFIFINFEARDQNWLVGGTDDAAQDGASDMDDNLEIKRLFGSHTFDFGTAFDFGLMTGAAWATSFGDNADGKWRLKFVHPLPNKIPIIFVVEKNAEMGSGYFDDDYTTPASYYDAGEFDAGDYPADAEADDADAYYAATILKVGDVMLLPLAGHVEVGNVVPDEDTDVTVNLLLFGAKGKIGPVDFEAEFNYTDTSYSFDYADGTPDEAKWEDYSAWGIYFKGWTNLDSFTVGGLFAYSPYDKDAGPAGKSDVGGTGAGYGFGEDFCPTVYGADWAGVGSTDKSEYYAVTLFQLFGEYAMNDALSFNASYTYWSSNEEETSWDGATGYEIDLGFNWQISDAVSYVIALGTGEWSFDEPDDDWGVDCYEDSEPFTRAYHKISIAF